MTCVSKHVIVNFLKLQYVCYVLQFDMVVSLRIDNRNILNRAGWVRDVDILLARLLDRVACTTGL